jgi:hypothetical protein
MNNSQIDNVKMEQKTNREQMLKHIASDQVLPNPMLADGLSSNFWDFHIKQRKVEPLSKPCKDCAISTGFYTEIADELKKENKETIDAVVDTWFCHNNCNRGCAGVRDYVKPCS